MGRKKIEIRPLVDERNRNVTFLKRKAGLMKKAWELSVLCAADVSIVIFSAAGKAYEFSSKELDGEIERYHEYEGMIERRRAPEFAAMALAGEDDDEDDDDVGPSARRGSKANASAGAAGNAQPRSLKGKETFKSRTVISTSRHGNSSGHSRRKHKRRDKSRSNSEKRSFIDSLLSGESSSEDDEEDSPPHREEERRRRKDEERGRRERDRNSKREADVDRARDDERAYSTSDKMMAGLQYALNMHSGPSGSQSNVDPRYLPAQAAGPSREPYSRDAQLASEGYSSHLQAPMSVPQLPRLPTDGANYRLPHGSGLDLAQLSQAQAGMGYAPALAQNTTSFLHTHNAQPYIPSHDHLLQANQASMIPSSSNHSQGPIPPTAPAGFHWDRDLIAKYAEFQLQQNHQRQQRILLERQRQQLANLGVPLDDRSLLDEIFGGMASASSASAGGGIRGGGEYLPMVEDSISQPSGEFIWPLAGSGSGGGGGQETSTSMEEQPSMNGGYDYRQQTHPVHGDMGWGMDGLDSESTGGRDGISLPSPVSASAGEGRRKAANHGRGEYDEEIGPSLGKRMRVG